MSTVLITGANRGIGLEFVRQYARSGHKVIACCRNPEKATELNNLANQLDISVHQLDITNKGQLQNLKSQLKDQPVDILINNAGIYGNRGQFGNTDPDEWLKVFHVNSIAPYLVTEALVELVAASNEKKIVAITSKMGSISDNGSGNSYIYRSSKTALNMVCKSLSVDLQDKGIKVAAIHPGWVQTDMGGPNALISTETSVAGIIKVIAGLTDEKSGGFFNYDGSEIGW